MAAAISSKPCGVLHPANVVFKGFNAVHDILYENNQSISEPFNGTWAVLGAYLKLHRNQLHLYMAND